ncbi:MAG: glycoside hydrolase family 43 protein [Balneolales bacterium]|nr:glycoside hydrolase family 43 protein [Balneolales bacterium]
MKTTTNPIIRGFNPDPSILRVGDDYYIATSTFEWFPGVQIFHSTDLVNWELINRPLKRVSQLDMRGIPDSCGVWAPCLSYKDGLFYLVFSNVKSFDGPWKDTPNYIVTTDDIYGDWSDPSFISSAGFDGSLFHDDDGKSYYMSMLMDHTEPDFFGGIVLQEIDLSTMTLLGEMKHITSGTELGCTEGPHIYKKDGFYYLILAEGGTEYGHAVSMLRSESIFGKYEVHPENPVFTARFNSAHPLQKAGHGDLVETPTGDWYAVFLVGRPLEERGRCILGRETAIEEVIWKDGWPYPVEQREPRISIPSLQLKPEQMNGNHSKLVEFNADELDIDFQSLRVPASEDWCSLKDRPGFLRLYGRESLTSTHLQSLIARRVQDFNVEVTTRMEFNPTNFQELAGLTFYYNTAHFFYLNVRGKKHREGKELVIISSDYYSSKEHENKIDVSGYESILLRGILDREELSFYYSVDEGSTFHQIGNSFDASILSDDYVQGSSGRYKAAFTGCFVGICCQDLSQNRQHADFEWFHYKEL